MISLLTKTKSKSKTKNKIGFKERLREESEKREREISINAKINNTESDLVNGDSESGAFSDPKHVDRLICGNFKLLANPCLSDNNNASMVFNGSMTAFQADGESSSPSRCSKSDSLTMTANLQRLCGLSQSDKSTQVKHNARWSSLVRDARLITLRALVQIQSALPIFNGIA